MSTRPTRPERPLPGKVTTPLPREPGAPTPILDCAIPPIASDGPAPASAPRSGPTAQQTPEIDPLIGVDVGDGYAIASRLAAGGMGALYVAQHRAATNKRKAIKVLLGDLLAKCSPRTREDIAHRFEVEARIALNLDHPNVINVDGWGTLPNGAIYIKMELLKGKDLRRWARDRHDGKVPADEVLQVFAQVCSALEQAHRLGVVHRDLKPENVFMVEHPEGAIATKLLDFGIAKVIGPDLPGGKKTTLPRAMGTPGYWSPEQQTSPGDVDHHADIYALGVIAYELLTGHLPGFGSLAPHMLPPGFPVEWYEPIAKALAGDPTKRHTSARDFLAELIAVTPDGATLAATACPTIFRTAAAPADSTIKAPSLASVPGMRNSAPPPPAPLPPSTLAQAAGAYGTQATPRRSRLALAAAAGAGVAGAIALAIVLATRPGSSSTRAPNSATTPPSSAIAPNSATAPSSTTPPSSAAAPNSATAPNSPTAPSSATTPPSSAATAPGQGPSSTAAADGAATRPTQPTSSPTRHPPRPPKRTRIERLGP